MINLLALLVVAPSITLAPGSTWATDYDSTQPSWVLAGKIATNMESSFKKGVDFDAAYALAMQANESDFNTLDNAREHLLTTWRYGMMFRAKSWWHQ